jgi:hypothetical protein
MTIEDFKKTYFEVDDSKTQTSLDTSDLDIPLMLDILKHSKKIGRENFQHVYVQGVFMIVTDGQRMIIKDSAGLQDGYYDILKVSGRTYKLVKIDFDDGFPAWQNIIPAEKNRIMTAETIDPAEISRIMANVTLEMKDKTVNFKFLEKMQKTMWEVFTSGAMVLFSKDSTLYVVMAMELKLS